MLNIDPGVLRARAKVQLIPDEELERRYPKRETLVEVTLNDGAKLAERVEAVRKQTSRIVHRPRCFLMEWVDPPFCSGHWGPELVEIAGGHDPLGRKQQPSAQIDWQQVLDACPEIIVLALCGYDVDLARRDYELLRRFSGFDSLPAARNGEIYLVNASAYFARPGPRIVDSLEILAGILHPKEFPEFASRNAEDYRVADHVFDAP